jgi:membrane-associated phospholipid phosphatase
MKKRLKAFLFVSFFISITGFAQKDTLIKKLDSLSVKADSIGNGKGNNINQDNYNEITKIDLRTYFILLGSDFKQQVVLPFHTKKKDWGKVAQFALITAVGSLADESISKYAVGIASRSKHVTNISRYVTNFGGQYEAITLASLAAYGWVFKNEKIKTTAILASQAYITSTVMQSALKFLTGRQRPIYYDPKTLENEPTFHGPLYQFKKDANGKRPDNISHSSFPSGHTTVAFAAATVFAMEYRDKPLIPIISYSAASLIGLSRLTENRHWPTDILVGAALGFLVGKQVVNNYHRYAKIKYQQLQKKKNTLSFHLQYFHGKALPGLVYKFN